MQIIPVIDLLAGQVVHAVGGQRHAYRPVTSALCDGAAPQAVVQRLCEHCATDTVYLADLDALQGGAPQVDALAALLQAHRRLCLWLDAGFAHAQDAAALLARLGDGAVRVRPVFGSESLASRAALREAMATWPMAVLSLDSRQGEPIDPAGVWAAPELWPTRVIAMGLERVGSRAGPDLLHFAQLRSRSPQACWIGSGGIRDEADLRAAQAAGAQAWLVASALHDGRLAAQPARAEAATDCFALQRGGHTVWQGLDADGAFITRDRTHSMA